MADAPGWRPPAVASPLPAVVVLGEALVDVFDGAQPVPGGAPFNVACWLAAFGVPTTLVTRLGAADGDSAASAILSTARRFGLGDSGIQRDALHATGRVDVQMAHDGHRFVIADDSAWDHIDTAQAVASVARAAPEVIYFGSLAQRHPQTRDAIRAALASRPALHLADLNLRPGADTPELAAATLQQADWAKVNDDELQRLLRWFVHSRSPVPVPGTAAHAAALAALVARFTLERLVVTCGAAGWYALDASGSIDARGPAAAVPALVDTVGAGDAFTAAVIAGMVHGRPLLPSLQQASRLAAAVCGWRGALPDDAAVIAHWCQQLGFGSAAAPSTPPDDPLP